MSLVEVIVHLFHPRRSNNHRARILHPESFVSLALVVVGFSLFIFNVGKFSSTLGSVLGYASDISVDQVVAQTNAQRASGGLGSVSLNGTLSVAAAAKAQDMFAQQYWSHVSPSGKQPWDFMREANYGFSAAGENLARDFSTTSEMMSAWMGSESHRSNIMNGKYQEIGVAVINGTLQGVETTLVVQMFGRPPQSEAAIPAAAAQKTEGTSQSTQVAVTQGAPAPTKAPVPTKSPTPTPEVTPTATPVTETQPIPTPEFVQITTQAQPGASVLSDTLTTIGSLQTGSMFSPLDIMKAVFISILLIIIAALAYDAYVFEHKNTFRMVGKNFAHIMYFSVIIVVILFIKSGAIQ